MSKPDLAFIALLAAVLMIYCEFIWPSKIFYGLIGCLTFLAAVGALAEIPGIWHAMAFFAASCAGFLVEAFLRTWFIAGAGATLLLIYGAFASGVSTGLSVIASFIFGAITLTLLQIAKRARQNKLRDIT